MNRRGEPAMLAAAAATAAPGAVARGHRGHRGGILLHGFDVYDGRAVIVGTLATTAVITDPDDVALHLDLLGRLEPLADYAAAARATLAATATATTWTDHIPGGAVFKPPYV